MYKFGWVQSPTWKLSKFCCMITKGRTFFEIVVPSWAVFEKMPRTKMLSENVSSKFASQMIVLHIRNRPNIWCATLCKPKNCTWEPVNDSCRMSKPKILYFGQPNDVKVLANPKNTFKTSNYWAQHAKTKRQSEKLFFRKFAAWAVALLLRHKRKKMMYDDKPFKKTQKSYLNWVNGSLTTQKSLTLSENVPPQLPIEKDHFTPPTSTKPSTLQRNPTKCINCFQNNLHDAEKEKNFVPNPFSFGKLAWEKSFATQKSTKHLTLQVWESPRSTFKQYAESSVVTGCRKRKYSLEFFSFLILQRSRWCYTREVPENIWCTSSREPRNYIWKQANVGLNMPNQKRWVRLAARPLKNNL